MQIHQSGMKQLPESEDKSPHQTWRRTLSLLTHWFPYSHTPEIAAVEYRQPLNIFIANTPDILTVKNTVDRHTVHSVLNKK